MRYASIEHEGRGVVEALHDVETSHAGLTPGRRCVGPGGCDELVDPIRDHTHEDMDDQHGSIFAPTWQVPMANAPSIAKPQC